ncbi:MAG: ABC transporter ATP-binding protein [Gammaproteobacteria bacterium]|nr:ABC transporter ATP-binding protein [Gammaproteobacteria bacterium]
MTGISVAGIQKRFGAYQALTSVSLEVRDSEFTVLLGPSGCGKSTLLRIIAGLEYADGGTIDIGQRRVNDLPPRLRRIAMVFQNYAVFPHMTIYDNVAFGLRTRKTPEAEVRTRVMRMAELMDIGAQLSKYSAQLSGGQRQRVAVARALVVEPEVLLMDEPLSNLDALLRLQMRAELKSLLQEFNTTTIYVTHDQVEAMSLADRIAVMNGGHIEQYGSPMQIYSRPATRFVGGFIGNPPMNFLLDDHHSYSRQVGLERPGKAHSLGIRPEDIQVYREMATQCWPVKVGVVECLGPMQQFTAELDHQMLRVTADPDLALHSGETLYLRPDPAKVCWYDGEGRMLPV